MSFPSPIEIGDELIFESTKATTVDIEWSYVMKRTNTFVKFPASNFTEPIGNVRRVFTCIFICAKPKLDEPPYLT